MYYAFLFSTIAGLSTLFGYFFIFFNNKGDRVVISSLSFAAGVMVCVSFVDLIPEGFIYFSSIFNGFPAIIILFIFFIIGIIVSDFFGKHMNSGEGELYRVGIVSMIVIVLHNIPEGIATFLSTQNNFKLGLSLSIAIAFHNIPEGISISVPIYYSTNSKIKAFFYVLISSLSEPFGAFIAFLFLHGFNNFIMGIFMGIIAGIMFYISFYELLPSSYKYKSRGRMLFYFMIGFLFILITHFILN